MKDMIENFRGRGRNGGARGGGGGRGRDGGARGRDGGSHGRYGGGSLDERSSHPQYHGNYNKNIKSVRGSGVITQHQPANRYHTTSTITDTVNNNIPPLYPITQAKSPQSTGGYLNDKNYIVNPHKLNKTYYPAQQIQTPVSVDDKHYRRRRRHHQPYYRNRRPYYDTSYTYSDPYPYYNPYYWFFPYENIAAQPDVTNIYPIVKDKTNDVIISDDDNLNNENTNENTNKKNQTTHENRYFNDNLSFIYLFIIIVLLFLVIFMK